MRLNIGGRKTNVASRKNYAAIALKIKLIPMLSLAYKKTSQRLPVSSDLQLQNLQQDVIVTALLNTFATQTQIHETRREVRASVRARSRLTRRERDGNGHSETTNPISIRVWRILDW
jgi:hypothetical protein